MLAIRIRGDSLYDFVCGGEPGDFRFRGPRFCPRSSILLSKKSTLIKWDPIFVASVSLACIVKGINNDILLL